MLLTDIIKKYKRGKICLIDINAKEIHSLRIAIAYSDIRAIRNIALKSIDFIITKRRDTETKIEEDITFFNEKTLAYSLSNIPKIKLETYMWQRIKTDVDSRFKKTSVSFLFYIQIDL